MNYKQRGIITINLSETEIKACSFDRLKVLFDACRRSQHMARVLQGSVVLAVPPCYQNNRNRETFEHPEIAKFAQVLQIKLPGFSFLINYDHDVRYKNFLLSSLSVLTLIRTGTKTKLRFSDDEWSQVVQHEVTAATNIANNAYLSLRQQEKLASRIRAALDQEGF